MTKHPSISRVTLADITRWYHARFFVEALSRYVAHLQNPGLRGVQLEDLACSVVLPFYTLPTFHKIKCHSVDGSGYEVEGRTVDALHCHPEWRDVHGKVVPGHFDAALVNVGDGPGGNVGVQGE